MRIFVLGDLEGVRSLSILLYNYDYMRYTHVQVIVEGATCT